MGEGIKISLGLPTF